MKRLAAILTALFALVALPAGAQAQASSSWQAQQTAAEATMTADQARQRVVEIVNQPIKHLSRTGEADVFSPGWFHPGAIEPDYDHVDVRATQELLYAKSDYVTSDLNPSEMFYGDELEFNAMTKFFYTDRTLPKKRLSEAEMLEINRLYRIIGHDKHRSTMRLIAMGLLALGFLVVVWLLILARRLA